MWFTFAAATTLFWGAAELFYKKGALPDERFSHLKICIFVGAVMGVHALLTLLIARPHYNPVNLLRYLPVSFLYILSMACSFFGLRFIEESLADPVENTSGALCTLMCCIFLGQKLSGICAAAILLIAAGVTGLGLQERRTERGRLHAAGKRTGLAAAAFLMPFLYALIDAAGSFLDIIYLEDPAVSPFLDVTEENIELTSNISYELTFALCALLLYIWIRHKGEGLHLNRQRDKLLAAVFETAGQMCYVYAMAGSGALAAPMISSVCVVSLLLSRIFLKERLTRRQYVFIALVIVGILILAAAEGE